MVQNILNNANDFLKKSGMKLPKRGFFTGQAAASLYLQEIGFDKYKNKNTSKINSINDIDVFVKTKVSSKQEMIKKKTEPTIAKHLGYGRIFGIMTTDKYQIERTKHIKDLNVTFYTSEENNFGALELIEKFDINCTQVAIDLETKEIFLSDSFKEFIKTGQLKVANISTPVHTAIRIVKKSREFGFYCNFEKELSKLVVLTSKIKYFTNNHYKHYLKNRDILDKYFDLKTEYPKRDWVDMYSDYEWKNEILYTLEKKADVKIFKEYIEFHKEIGIYSNEAILRSNEIFFHYSKQKKDEIENLFKNKFTDFEGFITPLGLIYEKQCSLRKDINPKSLGWLNRMLNEHENLAPAYYSFNSVEEMMDFHKNLKKLIFEKGILIVGAIENIKDFSNLPSDYEGLLKLCKESLTDLNNPLIQESIEEFSFANWNFKELVTKLDLIEEGSNQHHCVGGYFRVVNYGSSKIVSVKAKEANQKSYTIELRRWEDDTFYISQCLGKHNTGVSEKLISTFEREIGKHTSLLIITREERKKMELKKYTRIHTENIENDEMPF